MSAQLNVAPRECPSCGATFTPYRTNGRACSRECYRALPDVRHANATRKLRAETVARKNAARRVSNNPGRAVVNRRDALRRYGLTPAQWDAMYEAQGGVCAICARPANPNGTRAASRLHVDHDHATGKVRALLCNNCNRGIGYLADSAELLRSAAGYLESHRKEA